MRVSIYTWSDDANSFSHRSRTYDLTSAVLHVIPYLNLVPLQSFPSSYPSRCFVAFIFLRQVAET